MVFISGKPYSSCYDDRVSYIELDLYDKYTQNQCHQECIVKLIMDGCHCWPQSFGLRRVAKFRSMSICTFIQHAECVAQITSQFKPTTNCHCPRKCLQDELIIGHIQYGKYQGDKFNSRSNMLTSVMMYLKPEHKTIHLEHVEYEATQFFSDVGGAVGLILGISCTTVFGIIGH